MITLSSRVPGTRLSRLTWALYAYAFFEEFVLLYPLYALLFHETGLSVAQISSLFALWSLSGIVLALPAGALADVVPRRYLLAVAPLFTATAFALWLLFPGYWVFALGFVLWGAGGALASGAFEALAYTELEHRGAAADYARVMGVTRALGVAAVGVSTLVAVPTMAHGGFAAIGAASVAACLLCSLAGLALPEKCRTPTNRADTAGTADTAAADETTEPSGYLATLGAGLSEARGSRRVCGAIFLVIVITALWETLEEYVPLLADDAGVPTETVPVVVLVVWSCVTVGGLLAGPASRLPQRTLSVLLALAAVAIAAGALLGNPVGWLLLGAGFAVCQMMSVVADARLQHSITGPSRATVTSLAGLGTETVALVAFGLYASAFLGLGHAVTFTVFAVPYLVIAVVLFGKPARAAASRARGGPRSGPEPAP